MVIVRVMGGLGNQLFQYAAGISLAKILNTSLKLDIGFFTTDSLGGFLLNDFNVPERIIENKESCNKYTRLLIERFKQVLKRSHYYKEKSLIYDDGFFSNTNKDVYLDGYWQTEKYFAHMREQLLKELTLKSPFVSQYKYFHEQIYKYNSISLHVRRGDYVKDRSINQKHGTCSLEYYYRAMQLIEERVENPVYFIFSDDIEWVKQNLQIHADKFYIENSEAIASQELMLMSECKHNIIANSTFSWWGAWLNKNIGKTVISPQKWFNSNMYNSNDLCPASWIRI